MTSKNSNSNCAEGTLSVEGARNKFLATVHGIVNKDRNATYGSAEDSFNCIASFWRTYLEHRFGVLADVTALDVAAMMDLMKTARIANSVDHFDSWVDKAGYAACAGGILEQRKEFNDKAKGLVADIKLSNKDKACKVQLDSDIADVFKAIAEEATEVVDSFAEKEGGVWQPTDFEMSIRPQDAEDFANYYGYHAFRTTKMRVWDRGNGWRN